MDDDDTSVVESEPPQPAGINVPAAGQQQQQNHGQQAAQQQNNDREHPLWARAAGRGGDPMADKKNRRGGAAALGGGPSKFRPISLNELEVRTRRELDGGSTAAGDSEDEEGAQGQKHASEREDHARRKRRRDDDEDDEDDDVHCADYTPRGKREDPRAGGIAEQVAQAAFGGGAARYHSTALSVTSDTDDSESVSSAQLREAQRRACPISGVDCVGCVLPAKVAPVDEFVRSSCDKMQQNALYKMAALVYKTKVAEPAEAEGLQVPDWHWKQIAMHYATHNMDLRMQRFENVRTLATMRKTMELCLVREDEESGDMQLDKNNSEQIMKIIALQSKELSLVQDMAAGATSRAVVPSPGGGGKSGKKPRS